MPEIGRISGPLLKSNLTRDGVPLAFETDLLYLNNSDTNPANHKIGIKNTNPGYTLDVSGTIRTRNALLVKAVGLDNAYAEIDEVRIDDNKIQSTVGNLVLQAQTLTDKVQIKSNTIIEANLEVTGNITLGGTINIGDAPTDDVVFGGEIKSNIIPDAAGTYDLGSPSKTWRLGYFDEILVGGFTVGTLNATGTIANDQIEIVGNTIRTYQSNTNLELDAAGTGTIELLTSANITGDLTVSGDASINGGSLTTNQTEFSLLNTTATTVNFAGAGTAVNIGAVTGTTTIRNDLKVNGSVDVTGSINLGGNLTIGNNPIDTVTVQADFTSNLVPDASNTYDLGTVSQAWRNLFVENINIGGNMNFDQIAITGNKIITTQSNTDLELDPVGTGQVVILGNNSVIIPVGTTAERPVPARTGSLRLNTDTQRVENYNGVAWNRMLHDDDAIAFAIALG